MKIKHGFKEQRVWILWCSNQQHWNIWKMMQNLVSFQVNGDLRLECKGVLQ